MKYLTAIVAVVIRTFYELKKGKALFFLALSSSIFAMAYNIYWDIVRDWGLLHWNSINFLVLRDARLVSYKSVYYIAMVLLINHSSNFTLSDFSQLTIKTTLQVTRFTLQVVNVVLRIAWLQLVLVFDVKGLHRTTISTGISCLEIIRRGIWNFFR